jgi:ribosomal protein S18 acetylase RimI-like enzyme
VGPGYMSYELEMVSKVTESNVSDAVRILAGAFWNDPLVEYLFPELQERQHQLDTFFKVNVEFSREAGEVYSTTSMLGCSVWLFPGDKARSRLGKEELPGARFKLLLDGQSLQKLSDFIQYMKERHFSIMRGPYCLLMFLGVEEKQRRRGVGSRLMQPVLQYADEKRMPCILDTMNEYNLDFYRAHNFTVCQRYHLCSNGPETWTMIRYPQKLRD